MSVLFVRKWKDIEPEATRLINNSFFQTNENWFIGCAVHPAWQDKTTVSKVFIPPWKDSRPNIEDNRWKCPIVRQRSKEYILDKAPFNNQLHITDNLYKKGFELAASDSFSYVHGDEQANGEYPFFIFKQGITKNIILEDVGQFSKQKYKSFDAFAEGSFDIWHLIFPPDSSDWHKATCSCPAFHRENMCKHIIAMIEQPKLKPLANYDDEPLFFSKRGLPKKATGGLIRDSQ